MDPSRQPDQPADQREPERPDAGAGADVAFDLPPEDLIELFQTGEMEILGRMPNSSNATLLVIVDDGQRSHRGIYKPERGERPLRDFPPGLHKREAAMFRLAEALGWDVIPPTTLTEGPLGEGSVQAFVDADFSHHYFSLYEENLGTDDLRRLCALDIVANNTDRKSGHCLLGRDGRIYGIDNGLSFHAQFKLRTVMWDYSGQALPEAMSNDLARFVDQGPEPELSCLLNSFEVDAMMARTKALLEDGIYPDDDTGGHRWPWPLV